MNLFGEFSPLCGGGAAVGEARKQVNSFGLDCKDLDEHCCMQFKGLSIFYILAFSCNF